MTTPGTQAAYTLDEATPRADLDAALRGAVTALRDHMDYLSISFGPEDQWPPQVDEALTHLDLPTSWRKFLRRRRHGFSDDLDLRDPVEFALGLLFVPFAEHVTSIGGIGELASYEAGHETLLALNEEQYQVVCQYMTTHGADPAHLLPTDAAR